MIRHVSALSVGHLQGVLKFFDMCCLCVKLYGINSTYMIKIIVINIKYHNS